MTKKIFINGNIFLAIFLTSSISVCSQPNPVIKRIGTTSHCCTCRPCVKFLTDEAFDEHACLTHGIGCPSGNSTSNNGQVIKSPIGVGIGGAFPGVLVGSFLKDGNGKSQWATGVALGYGVFSTLSLLTTTKNRSLVENLVLGIVAGGAGGAGAGMYEKANASASSPKPDNTSKYAAIGAVIVGGLAAALPNEGKDKPKKSGFINKNGKPTLLSKISVRIYGDRIGLVMGL
jgi:hypothetical protein